MHNRVFIEQAFIEYVCYISNSITNPFEYNMNL